MSKVTGVVGWVGQNKFGKYSIKIEGNETWYNSNYEIKASKGDTVEFDDGGKKYCQKLKVLSGGSTEGLGSPSKGTGSSFRDRSIIRQNSLGHATHLTGILIQCGVIAETDADKLGDQIVTLAKKFEAYSSGDADKADEGFDPRQFDEGEGDFIE